MSMPQAISSFESNNDSFEQSNQNALSNVFGEYAFSKGKEIIRRQRLVPLDEWCQQIGMNEMGSYAALLEASECSSDNMPSNVSCTVCVPVALNETTEMVLETVRLLDKSEAGQGTHTELILWMNAPCDEDDDYTAERAKAHYTEFCDALAQVKCENLQVKTALHLIPRYSLTMTEIRASYMDALAVAAVERGEGFDYPVIWVDADTTFIAKGTLGRLAEEVRSFRTLFTHANLQYSADFARDTPLDLTDSSTRAFIVGEIARRRELRATRYIDNATKAYDGQRYYEESGFAVALGTYLKIGGVDKGSSYNETAGLIDRALNRAYERKDGILEVVDDFLPYTTNGSRIDLRSEICEARLGTSGRRIYEKIKQKGWLLIREFDQIPYDGPYCSTASMSPERREVSKKEIEAAMNKHLRSFVAPNKNDAQMQAYVEYKNRTNNVLLAVIERLFK